MIYVKNRVKAKPAWGQTDSDQSVGSRSKGKGVPHTPTGV